MRLRTILSLPSSSAVLSILAAAVLSSSASAQEWPDGWEARPDRAGTDVSEIAFQTMDPGWHVTTGPATILWDPARTASGAFRVESEIFLFDPQGRREAFGFFMGGKSLDAPDQAYVYFLIRPTGEFLIKRRAGDGTEDIAPWTANEAIVPWSAKEADAATVRNVLVVEAGAETVRFIVNDVEMASVPRSDLDLDGIVGLRVNHAVNIHVGSLEVTSG